jgi:hypothetical protein
LYRLLDVHRSNNEKEEASSSAENNAPNIFLFCSVLLMNHYFILDGEFRPMLIGDTSALPIPIPLEIPTTIR